MPSSQRLRFAHRSFSPRWKPSSLKRTTEVLPACDRHADITRDVAAETGSTLVDLRLAVKALMRNEGTELAPDGRLVFRRKLLTYDGVHLNARGCEVVADLIARGICEALRK